MAQHSNDADRASDDPLPDEPSSDPEVPDADAADQRRPASPDDAEDEPVRVRHDVPEADAIDQATPAHLEDEDSGRE
jgi:hypothetical protein